MIVIPAIDAKRGQVAIQGWNKILSSKVKDLVRQFAGVDLSAVIFTDIERDGTKDGYDIGLTRTISEAVSIPVIGSGGVGTLDHLYQGLVLGKVSAVLAASIFHYREYSIAQVKSFLKQKGVTVRI